MSTEKRIVASCLKSREAFDKIRIAVDLSKMTVYSSYLIDIIEEYYSRDKDAKSIDRDFLLEKIAASFVDHPKKAALYAEHAKECIGLDVSALNIAELILETKTRESAAELIQILADTDRSKQDLLTEIDRHKTLLGYASGPSEGRDSEILHNVSVKEINSTVLDKDGRVKILSKTLTDALDGGLMPGNTVWIYGRPEVGKTALFLSCARTFVKQGLDGIIFENEDPLRSDVERFQGCLTGMPRLDRLRDPDAAEKVLEAQGYGRARFIALTPGSVEQIDDYCREFKPKWIVVNQLRNLRTKAENRTNQLEAIASGLRTVAKARSLILLGVTQAGDSGTNKLVLEIGDVDSSNTGVPAQADVMIGIGMNPEFEKAGHRMIALPKNKLSGQHLFFPMKLNPQTSRYEDL
jgi:hypothetical protein